MDRFKDILSRKWLTAIVVSVLLIFTFVQPLFSKKDNQPEEQHMEQIEETEEIPSNQSIGLIIGKSDIIMLLICLGSVGGIKLKHMYDGKLKQK